MLEFLVPLGFILSLLGSILFLISQEKRTGRVCKEALWIITFLGTGFSACVWYAVNLLAEI